MDHQIDLPKLPGPEWPSKTIHELTRNSGELHCACGLIAATYQQHHYVRLRLLFLVRVSGRRENSPALQCWDQRWR